MLTVQLRRPATWSELTSDNHLEGIIPVNHQLASPLVDGSVTLLDIAPLDTSGHLLQLCCGPTKHVPVASRRLSLPSAELRIDILSASHRVVVAGLTNADDVTETVACGGGGSGLVEGPLPGQHQWDSPNWLVDFSSELRIGESEVFDAAGEVRRIANDRTSLVAQFPGNPLALTGLWVDSSQPYPSWQSWHLYPDSANTEPHVVTTVTRLEKKARS